MSPPGDILLVACYELGHQPLGLAWPAAFLERAGHAPAVMDLAVEPFDAAKARRAKLAAIAVPMHTALRVGVRAAARIREVNPACRIVGHGLYAVLNAEHLLAAGFDAVIAGEVEDVLAEMAGQLEAPPAAPRAVRLHKLAFPVPRRHGLPALGRYARLERDGEQVLAGRVEASRGCLHRCTHCPIPPVYGGRFFVVPREVVLADIRQLVEAGARHITFGDPDFLNGPGHGLAIARELHAAFPAVTFDVTAKIEHLLAHRARLGELAAAGCVFVVSAVESLSDTVLAHLAKGHTRADVERALAATRAAGLTLRPTWVPFTPWTTLADYRAMLDFIAAEDLVDAVDPVQLSIRLLVPPGSLLAGSPAMGPHLRRFVPEAFVHEWEHPEPAMDELHRRVTKVVAETTTGGDDAVVVFSRVRALADRAAGRAVRPVLRLAADRRRPPRLTEPWFC